MSAWALHGCMYIRRIICIKYLEFGGCPTYCANHLRCELLGRISVLAISPVDTHKIQSIFVQCISLNTSNETLALCTSSSLHLAMLFNIFLPKLLDWDHQVLRSCLRGWLHRSGRWLNHELTYLAAVLRLKESSRIYGLLTVTYLYVLVPSSSARIKCSSDSYIQRIDSFLVHIERMDLAGGMLWERQVWWLAGSRY